MSHLARGQSPSLRQHMTTLRQAFTNSGVTRAPDWISPQVAFCFASIMKHFFMHLRGSSDIVSKSSKNQPGHPPLLVLEVDVELGEGGQLAVVAPPGAAPGPRLDQPPSISNTSIYQYQYILGVFFDWSYEKC